MLKERKRGRFRGKLWKASPLGLDFHRGPQDSPPIPLLGCLGERNLESCFHPPTLQTNARIFMESRKMVLMNHLQRAWFHDVMVSTLDSESSDPNSSLGGTYQGFASLVAQRLKRLPAMQETWV